MMTHLVGDAGHITGHNDIHDRVVALANLWAVPVDITGPFTSGAPSHISAGHNDYVAAISALADAAAITVTLPDDASIGDTGHTADHALIEAALDDLEAVPVPPILTHTGYGEWTIANFDAGATYGATATVGSATITGNKVTASAVDTQVTVTGTTTGGSSTRTVERKAYTYTEVGSGSEYYFVGFGDSCPPGWRYEQLDPSTQVCRRFDSYRDGTPTGYLDGFGEWHRVVYS
jgi:hypothetical protein